MIRFRFLIAALLAVTVAAAVAEAGPRRPWNRARRRPWSKVRTPEPAPIVIGNTRSGYYDSGGDQIMLIAAEFRDHFSVFNAERVFLTTHKRLKSFNQSISTGRYDRKLDRERHAVYGFYDVTTGEYAYVVVRIRDDGQSAELLHINGQTEVINDWKYIHWEINGRRITLQIADDDKGGVAAIFHPIK